jgi:hypothetical protein
VGLTLAGIAVALAAWSGGFGARVTGDDLYVAFLPKHAYIAASVRAGRFPLWNPYEYCGLPLHGVAQGSVLYAPVLAANLMLAPLTAMRVLYALHILAFVLLALRYISHAGIGLAGAAAGAAIASACLFNGVGFGGADHPLYLYAVVYLVAILLAWEAIDAGKAWAAAALALCATVQWLPGYPEFPVESALLLFTMIALGARPGRMRRLALAAVLLGLGALGAAAQIVPLLETIGLSVRLDQTPQDIALRRLIFAMQDHRYLVERVLERYGGAALFAIAVGMASGPRRRLAWLVAFLWATFPGNRPFSLLYEVWPMSSFRFAFGLDTIAPLFAGCLVASGVDALRRRQSALPAWLPPALGLGLAGAAFAGGSSREAGLAIACGLASMPLVRWRGGWCVPLVLVILHSGGIMSRIGTAPRQPAPDVEALMPRATALATLRAEQAGEPRVVAGPELRAGLILPLGLAAPDGYEPASAAPRRVTRLGRHLGLDALSWGGENVMHTWDRLAASPGVARTLGIGLVAATPDQARPLLGAGYRRLADLPDGRVVVLQLAPARFQVVHAVVPAVDDEASFRAVTNPAFDPSREVVLASDAHLAVGVPPPGADEHVRVVAETPEHIVVDVTLSAPGVLVVRDTDYPGWEAGVDGTPAPILRANYAFRAVALAEGQHRVELTYRPLSFRLGVMLSLLGLAATLCVWRVGRAIVPRVVR